MRNVLFVLTLFIVTITSAQKQGSGVFTDDIYVINAQSVNNPLVIAPEKGEIRKYQQEDELHLELGGFPYRFGVVLPQYVDLAELNPNKLYAIDGLWHEWYSINAAGATSVNIALSELIIPEGDRLYFHSKDGRQVFGPFVQNDIYKGQLGTELLFSEEVVLHYISTSNRPLVGRLDVVNYGYKSRAEISGYAKSTCHIDVNCPEADAYASAKDGVVLLINSSNATFCSGSMVANTNYDGKPYVLSASHCYFNAPANWVFRFKYQAEECDGATAESFVSVSGGEFRSRYNSTDHLLVEIVAGLESGQLPAATNAYFNGWDFTGRALEHAAGIHHPSGVMKKISFDDHVVRKASVQNGTFTSVHNGVWRVNWDRGTATENKSSGSPLFDSHQRIVGQLWGGGSSCADPSRADFYGRFFYSWNYRTSPAEQLEHWLDPSGLSGGFIDGHRLGELPLNKDVAITTEPIFDAICSQNDSLLILMGNVGASAVSTIDLVYTFDDWTTSHSYTYNGTFSSLEVDSVYIPLTGLTSGWNTLKVRVGAVDGAPDMKASNDTLSVLFMLNSVATNVHLTLELDCYASETTWQIRNEDNEVMYYSPFYANFTDAGVREYDFCLPNGCYVFEIFDQYGDGFSFANASGCAPGSLRLFKDEFVFREISNENPDFGASQQTNFCVGPLGVNALANTFNVFPNPVIDQLTIQTTNLLDEVRICTVEGRLVEKNRLANPVATIHLPINLSKGYYLLEGLSNGAKVVGTKIVVE